MRESHSACLIKASLKCALFALLLRNALGWCVALGEHPCAQAGSNKLERRPRHCAGSKAVLDQQRRQTAGQLIRAQLLLCMTLSTGSAPGRPGAVGVQRAPRASAGVAGTRPRARRRGGFVKGVTDGWLGGACTRARGPFGPAGRGSEAGGGGGGVYAAIA